MSTTTKKKMIPEFLKENSFENVFADLLTILKMF